jgi:hypothetical protein
MRLKNPRRRGYMLRDLVASLVMIILLLGIVLPGCGKKDDPTSPTEVSEEEKARQAAEQRKKRTSKETLNNLRQLAIAVHTAVGDYKRLPPSGTNVKVKAGDKEMAGYYGAKSGSLYYHLLPYLEQMNMYETGTLNGYVAVFHAPADPSDKGSSDKAQATGTGFPFNGHVFNQGGNIVGKNLTTAMPDGTAYCILFGTGAIQSNDLRDAAAPDAKNCNITDTDLPQFSEWYPGKAKTSLFQAFDPTDIAIATGYAETRVVSAKVSAESWKAAMIPNDNKNPGKDF